MFLVILCRLRRRPGATSVFVLPGYALLAAGNPKARVRTYGNTPHGAGFRFERGTKVRRTPRILSVPRKNGRFFYQRKNASFFFSKAHNSPVEPRRVSAVGWARQAA